MVKADSVIPFYAQVKDDLLRRIQAGELAAGSRIPSEKELTEYYGVSTITIRRATLELVEAGILERKQGKGTFVIQRAFNRTFLPIARGFTEVCQANGMKASARLLEGEIQEKPESRILQQLGLPAGSAVVFVRRLRFADDQPVVIETNYFPLRFSYLLELDLDHDSMYQAMRSREPGLQPYCPPGQRQIRLISCDKESAGLLNVKAGSTVLYSEAVVWDNATGTPLHTSTHIGYAQKYNFTMQV